MDTWSANEIQINIITIKLCSKVCMCKLFTSEIPTRSECSNISDTLSCSQLYSGLTPATKHMLFCETFHLLCHLAKQTVSQLGLHIQALCNIYIVQQSLRNTTSKWEALQNATSKTNPSVFRLQRTLCCYLKTAACHSPEH